MRGCWQARPLQPSLEPQTVAGVLAEGEALLAGDTDARADAQILLAFALGRERAWLISHGESLLNRGQAEKYLELCKKRAAGMPVAYITGFSGFYKREFAVNEHVLIPRPETEHLVEDAIIYLRSRLDPDSSAQQVFTVFEAGVGSGAIACTIAAEVPGAIVEGTDSSAEAVRLAEYNARRLNVHARCTFTQADVVKRGDQKNYDLVIANLPYIPAADVPQKPDPVGYEPRLALDGGPDGLSVYRRLLVAVPKLLWPGGLLLMEAAPPTVRVLRDLTAQVLPQTNPEVRSDYAGLERYVFARGGRPRNGE